MALSQRLQRLLDRAGVDYETIPHRDTDTTMGAANSAHVAGRRVAKVVIVRPWHGPDFMVVLPANQHVDRHALQQLGRDGARLEQEEVLRSLFPDCELGAMPPFGALYDMPMYLDPCLAQEDEIVFQAGNHHELVRMRFEDYERLAKPIVGGFCLHLDPVTAG